MSGLAGRRILIPRAASWGARVQADLAAHGAEGVIAPLIDTRPPRDTRARDRAFAELEDGQFDWLLATSAASFDALGAAAVTLPGHTQLAVVGPATAGTARDAGYRVDFIPSGTYSAHDLAEQWIAAGFTGRVLVIRSDLAMAHLSDALELAGIDVTVCVGYRTVGVALEPDIIADIEGGRIDAILITSPSVAREVVRQLPVVDPRTILVSMGSSTTREAERMGLRPRITASRSSVDGMFEALATYWEME